MAGATYTHEPMTRGKVVLETTYGPIDIELWPKECPLACRNFVQLCMEDYYDGCIFHRAIKDFMAQTGDPTNEGTGGQSIWGENFKDEFHQRLRFSHRGLVACASSGANTNGSQFFFTLAETGWLDKKHTIFGKVTGNSIYNLMKLNELEVDADDRPLYPPKLLSSEVLWNPFDDIVPRIKQVQRTEERRERGAKDAVPMKKKLNLLSFGDEAEEEDNELEAMAPGKKKIKSAHDVVTGDTRLVAADVADEIAPAVADELGGEYRMRLKLMGKDSMKDSDDDDDDDDDDDADEAAAQKRREEALEFDKKMRENLAKRQKKRESFASAKDKERVERLAEMKALTKDVKAIKKRMEDAAASNDPFDARNKAGSVAGAPTKDTKLLSYVQQQRQKYLKKRKSQGQRQDDTLEKLKAFQESVVTERKKFDPTKVKENTKGMQELPSYKKKKSHSTLDLADQLFEKAEGQPEDEDEDDEGWVNTKLSFERDRRKERELEMNRAYENYQTFDPRKGGEYVGGKARDGAVGTEELRKMGAKKEAKADANFSRKNAPTTW